MNAKVLFFSFLMASSSVMATSFMHYQQVLEVVQNRDLEGLKKIRQTGFDLNQPDAHGMTPLCQTILTRDYEGYEMLLTQGASPYVACVRQLPQNQVASFYANQPKANTFYKGRFDTAQSVYVLGGSDKAFAFPMLGFGELVVGGLAAGVIAAWGSGGSGGSGDKIESWQAPLKLDPKDFETEEYQAKASPIYDNPMSYNFLGAIHAADAYARGYTGYKVKRFDDGTLDGIGEEAISENKVRVAVFDDGVWAEHEDLKNNMLSGANFVYGVCSSGESTNCWSYNPAESVATFQVNDSTPYTRKISENAWYAWASKYTNYTYNSTDTTPLVYKEFVNAEGVVFRSFEKDGQTYLYNPRDGQAYPLENDGQGKFWYGTNAFVKERTNYNNHGTHVAGLIGATKNNVGMMGVAYNAALLPVRIDLDLPVWPTIASVVPLADILNFSIASLKDNSDIQTENDAAAFFKEYASETKINAFYDAVADNNKIMVVAAGNYTWDGDKPYQPSVLSYAPLSDEYDGSKGRDLTNLLVNVIALNSNNELASYSAKCGVTQNYCLAAPGGDGDQFIFSTNFSTNDDGTKNSTYMGMQGTSMATPIVSGALAVLKGAFPHLTNQEVVQILFETATDLGDEGVDEIYGHGLVNLKAATNPVGLPKIVLGDDVNSEVVLAAASSASVPAALSGLANALPNKMVVFDKYNRAFERKTADFVRVAKRENKLDGRFKSFMNGKDVVVAQTDTVRMRFSERLSNRASDVKKGSVLFSVRPFDKWQFKTFYSEDTTTSGGTYFERLMLAPYAQMKEVWGGAVSYDISKNWQATVLGQVGQNGFVDVDDLNDMEHNKSSLFQSTLQYNGWDKLGVKLTAGVANEQGSVLGMWGRGAFKFGNGKTSFVGGGVTFRVTDSFVVEGMYYTGRTQVSKQNSLVQMADLKSDSFAVTALWQMDQNRELGFQFVSPLRITQGRATVSLPVARDVASDAVYHDVVQADLKPNAREYDLGFYYTDAVQENVFFKSELGVRLNPDHVAGAAPDWRALVGLRLGL